MLNTRVLSKYFLYLPIAVLIIIFFGIIYVNTQQVLRQSANDPQIEIAENIVYDLINNRLDLNTFSRDVDLSRSLSTFVIIYDDKGVPIHSSAVLEGKIPQIPSGVLENVRIKNEERLTWEPRNSIREAIVVKRYQTTTSSGFVLVGRSLREIEQREQMLMFSTLMCFILTLIIALASFIWFRKKMT